MKKISIKASVAAVSLTLALTPLGFAQSPSGTQVASQPTANTQPARGSKLAGQEVVAAGTGGLTVGMTILGVLIVAGLVYAVSRDDDNNITAITVTQTR